MTVLVETMTGWVEEMAFFGREGVLRRGEVPFVICASVLDCSHLIELDQVRLFSVKAY